MYYYENNAKWQEIFSTVHFSLEYCTQILHVAFTFWRMNDDICMFPTREMTDVCCSKWTTVIFWSSLTTYSSSCDITRTKQWIRTFYFWTKETHWVSQVDNWIQNGIWLNFLPSGSIHDSSVLMELLSTIYCLRLLQNNRQICPNL